MGVYQIAQSILIEWNCPSFSFRKILWISVVLKKNDTCVLIKILFSVKLNKLSDKTLLNM